MRQPDPEPVERFGMRRIVPAEQPARDDRAGLLTAALYRHGETEPELETLS